MSVPKPDARGVRWYGQWAGNEKGTREYPDCCIEEVWSSGATFVPHQCRNKRGKGPDGLYCGTHAKRAQKRAEAYEAGRRAVRDAGDRL